MTWFLLSLNFLTFPLEELIQTLNLCNCRLEIWILSRWRTHLYNHCRVNLVSSYLVKFTLFSFWDRGKQQVKEDDRGWFVLQRERIFVLKSRGRKIYFILFLNFFRAKRNICVLFISNCEINFLFSRHSTTFLFCLITCYMYHGLPSTCTAHLYKKTPLEIRFSI